MDSVEDTVEELIGKLSSPDAKTRSSAAFRLGHRRDERAIPELIKAMDDTERKVRRRAIIGLGMIGTEPAIKGLMKTFKTNDLKLLWAFNALKGIGITAIPLLIKSLDTTDESIRNSSIEALRIMSNKCKSYEELEEFEMAVNDSAEELRRGHVAEDIMIKAHMALVKLNKILAERKNELAQKRGLMLDGKPKTPKTGGKIWQAARRRTIS